MKDNDIHSVAMKIMEGKNPKMEAAGDSQWHQPRMADEETGSAFRSIESFKLMFDRMEEIPKDFQPLYKQAMTTMDALAKARNETNQLREMAKTSFQRIKG